LITTETLSQLFDHSLSAVCVTQEQKFVYANEAFYSLTGITDKSEIVGKPLEAFSVNPAETLPIVKNKMRESGDLIPSSYEITGKRRDGSLFPATVSASTISFEDRTATLVIVKDITAEKAAQAVLDDLSHTLVALYENTAESLVLIDRDFRMKYFNKSVKTMIESIYRRCPQKGESILDYSTIDSIEEFKRNVNDAFNGIPLSKEVEIKYINGTSIWWRVAYRPIILDSGEIRYVAFTAANITEVVLVREDLRLQNERLNSLHELMTIQDLSEREVVEFAMEEVVRITKSEVGYIHFVETQVEGDVSLNLFTWSKSVGGKCLIPELIKYPMKDAGVWADCVRTGKPAVHNDYQHMAGKRGYPEGHFPVERHLSVPVFEDELPKLIVGVGNKKTEYTTEDIRDLQIYSSELWKVITKKRLIEELRKAKEHAEKAAQLKSDFLSQMSHEIRSPMNVILGSIDILRDEIENPEGVDLSSTFTAIENSGQRIVRTLNMILNMAELQSGNFVPHIRTVDLKPVLKKLAGEYLMKCKFKGLDFAISLGEGDHHVLGDEYSLTQIFGNLMDNAIKYTNTGAVKVTSSLSPDGKLIVEVADSGIGISNEFRDTVFSPFRQEDQGYGRNFEGNGLGLALVKKYCDINSAEITFESEKNQGTRFIVKMGTFASV